MSDVAHAQDESLSGAALHMPDIEELEIANGDRDDQGRFKANQEEAGRDAEETEEPAKEADADDPAKEAEADNDDDEDYFELPPAAEGEEPQRLKATEVFEGYQRAQDLQAELENVRATAPPPPDYDRAIMEAVEVGQQYLFGLQQLEQQLQPMAPNQDLINPNSPDYDPEMYFNQQQHAQAQAQQHQHVQAERQRVEQETHQRTEAVGRAKFAREQQKLFEVWPELKEEAGAHKVRDEASRHYGIDEATLNSVHDSRFYSVLKDALAYREQSAAKETAVKVVKAKPKLVKGKARQGNPANRRSQDGLQRLQQSGSLEDARDALEGLL